MKSTPWKRTGVIMLVMNFLFATFPATAQAGLIGTDRALAAEQRGERIDELRSLLAREDVRKQMLTMGVSPAEVESRLNTLTPAEMARLSARMSELPAGAGVIEVVGVVFVVLLILELLDVTDVFTGL